MDFPAFTISASPELQIEVQAHTDYKGSGKLNLQLSEQRALSVKAYLVSKGVNENQLTAKGYGESQPIADNKTEEGRAKNRRVELKLVKDDVIKTEKQKAQSAGESVPVSEDAKVEDTIKTEEGVPEVETIIDAEKQLSEPEVKQ